MASPKRLKIFDKTLNLVDFCYPVGSLYWTSNADFDPNVEFGGGSVWERIKDRFVLAAGDTYTTVGVGNVTSGDGIGGSASVTLTTAQMPSHSHGGSTGSVNLNHSHDIGDANLNHKHSVTYTYPYYRAHEGTKVINGESDRDMATLGENFSSKTVTSGDALGSHSHSCSAKLGDHSHTISAEGGNQPHENMPPYIVKYCWERIQ